MRILLILTVSLCHFAHSQIQVAVWTDKAVYEYGDTVRVTVTAYNPTEDTINLHFGSSCQSNFIIDTFNFYHHILCSAIITGRSILPHQVIQWPPTKYPMYHSQWPILAAGIHTVLGEVLGYAFSDTLTIMVKSPTSISEDSSQPIDFALHPNYPNPFNGETTIPFSLSTSERVVVSIYSGLGQLIRVLIDETMHPGLHQVRADLRDLSSGMYWCCLQVGMRRQTQRLVLTE